MLIIRFFGLLLLTTLVSFFRMTPWGFLKELLIMPGQFFTCLSFNDQDRVTAVQVGTKAMLDAWKSGEVTEAPDFLKRRFETLAKEVA